MDFKQLEAYVKIIELKSFSKAAESIYLSQPSVSLYINSLEKELETQLIVRTTKDIKPTKTGQIFYEYAKDILSLKNKAIFAVQKRFDCKQGDIEVFASSVPAQYILPEVMAHFNKAYPNISFKITQLDTKEVVKSVIFQKCELGMVGAKIEEYKCYYEHILSENLIVIAPPDKKYDSLSIKNISQFFYKENLIIREEGSATRYFYESFMRSCGVKSDKLNIVACFSNTQSIIHAVSKGLGIAIVSEFATKDYVKQKLVLPIDLNIPLPTRDFYFVIKNEVIVPPQVNLFVDFVCKYFENIKSTTIR